jgi:hypothetical protein
VIDMRRSRMAVLFLAAILVLGLAAPGGAVEAEHTAFHGLYFPAGMAGTDTECPPPYVWIEMPPMCAKVPFSQTVLPNGRVFISDLELYELAFAYGQGGAVEPRKTGYDLVVANAYLDSTYSGPTWGTWRLYSFSHVLMFKGIFTGRFKNGIPAVHYFGEGRGIYEGQIMFGRITRVPDPWNMFGHILDLGTP